VVTAGLVAYASALVFFLDPAQGGQPAISPAFSFEKHSEWDCDWALRESGGPIRGSIRRSEQSPVLEIFDPAFTSWSDNEEPKLELSAGTEEKRVAALSYVIHWKEKGSALSIFLDEDVRPIVGGASQLHIWSDGRPVLNLKLSNTPSPAELAACVSEGD
jgi:hypothetical protein